MLTKIKKIFVLVILAAFVFALTGCSSELEKAVEALSIDAEITEDFVLPSVALDGAVTEWTSSDPETIAIDNFENFAEVFRPSGSDAEVTLSVSVTLGEENVKKDFVVIVKCLLTPDKITINVGKLKPIEGATDKYYLVAGEAHQLTVEVADEEMSTEVNWTLSSSKRAEITADGVITGKSYGEVKVTATSTSDSSVSCTITLEVVEDTNPMKVLLNNKKKIEEQIPEFISSAYTFPMPENDDVEAVYTYSDGEELYYGEYEYLEGVDRQETIYCTLTYKGESTEFEFIIRVVSDEENNEFLALDYAVEKLDAIFNQHLAGGTPITGDIDVPETFSAEEALFDVKMDYSTETEYQPKPVKFVEDDEENVTAVYTKPNDDAAVRVVVDITTANVGKIVRYNVVAGGYSKAEIVEYLQANVLPKANDAGEYKLVCQHVTLPTVDTTGKFANLAITWESSNPAVLTNEGKFADPSLAAQTAVTLTAKIAYKGTVNETFGFEESIAFEYDVFPAENKAQSVALQLSNFIDAPEFMDQIKYFPFGKTDRLDADGKITNVLPLPTTIGAIAPSMTEYADVAITWTANEEGLLDENFKLLKQYLRYHEVVLTYGVEVEGNVSTNEVKINVGITEISNTIYIGGNIYQQSGGGNDAGDVLCQLSKFDAPRGVLGSAARTWGYSYGKGQFNGYTWYIDEYVLDEEGNPTSEFTRYQYFAAVNGFIYLDDQYSITFDDAAGKAVVTLNETLNAEIGTNYGGNWAQIYYNMTDKEVKIPLSPYTGGDTPFVDEAGAAVKWTDHPWKKNNIIDRENAFGMDGYRVGFVTDAEGNVIEGYGDKVFQSGHDINGDKALTEEDFWVTIPAGGYAYSTKTQQNNAAVVGRFCFTGLNLHITKFDPFYLSPDGNTDGLGSLVQPQ